MTNSHTTSGPLSPSRRVGRTDLVVSPIGLGGNVFGWTIDKDQSFAVLDAYRAAGGNFIDTADSYAHWAPGNHGGESESIIGAWFASRRCRDEFVVATKVGKLPAADGLSKGNIADACEASLRRLGTDRIDLYYAHRDDANVPLRETADAFDTLVRSGQVRYLAASNFAPARLREALTLAHGAGVTAYCAIQDEYNLMERGSYEADLAPLVAEFGLASFPYYGLARGFLSGKYASSTTVDSPRAQAASAYLDDRGRRVLAAVSAVAAAHRVTSAAVALAWLLAHPTVTAPLASARTPEQLADLVAAGSVELAPDEIDHLDDASR